MKKRNRHSKYLDKKTAIKFDNLRLLDLHAELALQKHLKHQFNLVMRFKQLNKAIEQIHREEE